MMEILIRKTRKFRESFLLFSNFMYLCPRKNKVRGVAQLVSAPRSGRGGRTFESSHPDLQSQSLEIEVVAIVVLNPVGGEGRLLHFFSEKMGRMLVRAKYLLYFCGLILIWAQKEVPRLAPPGRDKRKNKK